MLKQDYYNDFFEIGQQKINFSFFELSLPDDDPVYTLKKVMEELDFSGLLACYSNKGRTGYNPIMLYAVVTYANMRGIRSVDRIVDLCQRDLAFIWLTKGQKPQRDAFYDLKEKKLTEEVLDELNYQFMRRLEKEGLITLKELYIDGTKIEANANRYTFVWRGSLNMRAFYLAYEKCQTVSGKLSWSHYCELLSISDVNKRSFYEKEAVNSNWSVRELKRQIDSSLYERLLLSSGDANKEKVLALAQKGIEINQPADIIRDPYVFEFLGVPENKPMLESDLEKALVAQIEKFLLELGRGFMFVGTQQRVTLNNTHYYVDMVFYNKILRAYVLIELKTTKLTPEAAGQLNMYLNYYAAEVNDPDDNPPIGIILCTEKDSVAAEYALGGLSNNIFASRYVLYMPDKEQLIAQVEAVLKNWHEKNDGSAHE